MTYHDESTGLAIIDAEHHLVPTTAIEIAEHDATTGNDPRHASRQPWPVAIPSDEAFAGRSYLAAPVLQRIGMDLIERKPRFSHLHGMRIEFLWKRKGVRKSGTAQRGFCRLAGDLIGYYAEVDFIIGLAADVCRDERLSAQQIEAALHHELMHAGAHDETNTPMLWPHDFEGFALEVEDYGMWTTDLQTAAQSFRQLGLFRDGVR